MTIRRVSKRDRDNWREALDDSYKKDLFATSLTQVDNSALARHVDAEAVNKCRIATYRQQVQLTRKLVDRWEYTDRMEKYRDATVGAKMQRVMDPRAFNLEDNVAAIYFKHYGHGFNGSPVMDRFDAPWICPGCGLKVATNQKLMPLKCPTCGRISPVGELKRDGVLRR